MGYLKAMVSDLQNLNHLRACGCASGNDCGDILWRSQTDAAEDDTEGTSTKVSLNAIQSEYPYL